MIAGHQTPESVQAHQAPRATAQRGQLAAEIAAVASAVLASLCCIGPVLFVTLGVGAGLASRFEPLRPLFAVLTLALLGVGFYTVYGRRPATGAATNHPIGDASCAIDATCTVAQRRTRDKVLVWSATVLAVIMLTFPQWSLLFV